MVVSILSKIEEKKKIRKIKRYNNKHKIIQIMLCDGILFYFYPLSLIFYNVIG